MLMIWNFQWLSCCCCRWMKKPRCGVPDQIGGATKFSVRKRRYALTGQKWQHKHITYRWVFCWINCSITDNPSSPSILLATQNDHKILNPHTYTRLSASEVLLARYKDIQKD